MHLGVHVREVVVEAGDHLVLASTTLSAAPAEVVAIMGPSGSGKTTLLACVGGTAVPTSGKVEVDGSVISELAPAARARFRREHVGLVFQDPELLDELTVGENVALQLIFSGVPRSKAREQAMTALDRVSLAHLVDSPIQHLSGGEAQRVAVARATIRRAAVILADEPTASLDATNARLVTDLLITAARDQGSVVLLATHDADVAAACDRVVSLRETRVDTAQ
ncbi:ABC transporter ATP-binding protein [Blastococcus sp. TF02-8]|uniref:ABC transporter ATP-binding protein n=1 Tax=Blastococcus sp. TF02-8 TaxID=2250574 RepID=UPI000DEB6683|nr:ATP-binding cassette domain-containing protein [Blastococcus sp. TF02-8]RBY96937.1 ABC transporter ATP-binding protein [Blastococcus sp. TF02-8]